MGYNQAINLMASSVNMRQWNENRELVKAAFPFKTVEELRKTPLPFIDGSGLVSKTLSKR